jgi:hypothetical protein
LPVVAAVVEIQSEVVRLLVEVMAVVVLAAIVVRYQQNLLVEAQALKVSYI